MTLRQLMSTIESVYIFILVYLLRHGIYVIIIIIIIISSSSSSSISIIIVIKGVIPSACSSISRWESDTFLIPLAISLDKN